MAWIPAVIKIGGAVIGALSSAAQASGTAAQGKAAQSAANAQYAQAKVLAAQQREKGRVDAADYRKEGARLLSKQRNMMASSGFMSDDATNEKIRTDTVGELSLQELRILAMAENDAKQTEYSGQLVQTQGQQANASARILALGQGIQGFTSWRDLYGGGTKKTNVPASNGYSGAKVLLSAH